MQVFNRQVSARGLTVFGFETILISGSILVAAQLHGSLDTAVGALWKIVLATALCELCFYYNDLYDLTIVHSRSELLVRILQAAGAASIVLAAVTMLTPSLIIGRGIFIRRRAGDASLRHQQVRSDVLDPHHPETVLFENATDSGQQMIVAAPERRQHAPDDAKRAPIQTYL